MTYLLQAIIAELCIDRLFAPLERILASNPQDLALTTPYHQLGAKIVVIKLKNEPESICGLVLDVSPEVLTLEMINLETAEPYLLDVRWEDIADLRVCGDYDSFDDDSTDVDDDDIDELLDLQEQLLVEPIARGRS